MDIEREKILNTIIENRQKAVILAEENVYYLLMKDREILSRRLIMLVKTLIKDEFCC
jgi:hypothetical protein